MNLSLPLEVIQLRLESAATDFDRRQSKKRGYNPYALGIYLNRIELVTIDIANGATPRQAIIAGFNDRICDVLLAAVVEPKCTQAERQTADIAYTPASYQRNCNDRTQEHQQ